MYISPAVARVYQRQGAVAGSVETEGMGGARPVVVQPDGGSAGRAVGLTAGGPGHLLGLRFGGLSFRMRVAKTGAASQLGKGSPSRQLVGSIRPRGCITQPFKFSILGGGGKIYSASGDRYKLEFS